MYVTDTHAFLWFVWGDNQLGKEALKIFRACDKGNEIVVIPTISLLECMYVCEKRGEQDKFQEIMRRIKGTDNYQIYPLDVAIVLECQNINSVKEMHDRIIVGTAKLLNVPLITKDKQIISSKVVKAVW